MTKEPVEVILMQAKSLQPRLIIMASGVFKLKDGKMKKLEPDPLLGWINRAFWLHHALDKDFDPGEYRRWLEDAIKNLKAHSQRPSHIRGEETDGREGGPRRRI